MADEDNPSNLAGGVVIVGFCLLVALWAAFQASQAPPLIDPLHNQRAHFRQAFVVLDGERTLISVVLTEEPKLVATLDSRTGERVAIGPVCPGMTEGRITIHQPDNEWLWVSCGDDDFALLNLLTATPVVTKATVAAAHPEVAAGVRMAHPTVSHDVEAPTVAVKLTLHDGRSAWVDMGGDLLFAPPPGDPWEPGYFCWPGNTCSTERRECLSIQRAPSGQGMVLMNNRLHGERQRPSETVSEWPAGFLRPGFVKQPANRCAFEEDDRYLLLHDSAAFDPKESLLSSVGRDGALHWTRRAAELGAPDGIEPRRAQRVGDQVLVLSMNESTRNHLAATWLDLATGDVLSAQQLLGRP